MRRRPLLGSFVGWGLVVLAGTLGACASGRVAPDPVPDPACGLLVSGLPARAIILDSREVATGSSREAVVLELSLRVLPSVGKAFDALASTRVSRLTLPQLQAGNWVPVRFDPVDHGRVAVDFGDCRTPGGVQGKD